MASQKPQKAVTERLPTGFNLDRLRSLVRDAGCTALYAKRLAPNDNNKNQPYFAARGEMRVFNILPVRAMHPHRNTAGETSFVADIDFTWLMANGSRHPAPRAKLILYPQYPEVRFSGFLDGASFPAADLIRYDPEHSLPERILFVGVTPARQTFGFVTLARGPVGRQFAALGALPQVGVFYEVPLAAALDSRSLLCRELHRIHDMGWIDSVTLTRDATGAWQRVPCRGNRCGGCTLETELGIPPNDQAEPDFQGWEVKQHRVSSPTTLSGSAITLFTPAPTGGVYSSVDTITFVRRYGYPDVRGRHDRQNFGGTYRAGRRSPRTRLTLQLDGYDATTGKITDASQGVCLYTDSGTAAAVWPYTELLAHWNRKHQKAAYVPCRARTAPRPQFSYGKHVRLATDTDFLWLLRAFAQGNVYLEPAIDILDWSTIPRLGHCRFQFRVSPIRVQTLYRNVETVDVTDY